jgi:carbamoyltransferase
MNKSEIKSAILLTLGHHASAIYYDGETAVGFEEERLTRNKAESRYPRNAIAKLEENCDIAKGSHVFVSHWFDTFKPVTIPDGKYFDKKHFTNLVDRYDLAPKFVSNFGGSTDGKLTAFTHHDAHAWSALSFFWDKLTPQQRGLAKGDTVHVIVLDGFGNWQEAISVYEVENGARRDAQPELVRRVWGYERSMGLMYQYATSYCGMKENQDEYKFLGYESHIDEILPEEQWDRFKELARSRGEEVFESFLSKAVTEHTFHTLGLEGINTTDLHSAKTAWHEHFDEVFAALGLDPGSTSERDKRVIIGNYVQTIVEDVMIQLIDNYDMKHVLVAGGVFYNVKLNNRFMKHVPGLFSVVPLAGDQGCGVGMYEHYVGGFKFGDLKWSPRSSMGDWRDFLLMEEPEIKALCEATVRHFTNIEEFTDEVAACLDRDQIVNIVAGNMEFGPRALCSTTTLARPFRANVETINALNDRDTVMPMAPVLPFTEASRYFNPYNFARVVGSDRYMIITYDYVNDSVEGFDGVAHAYPVTSDYVGKYSGRPQFVTDDDHVMTGIFDKLGALSPRILVNTSFNAHGRPIVYSTADVVDSYLFQLRRAVELKTKLPFLYIYEGEDA